MKKYTIFNGIENLTKKQVIAERSAEKRSISTELQNYANSIEFAYKQLTATSSAARNSANAAKGFYKTALAMVAACYPYQSKNGGICRVNIKDGYKDVKFDAAALLTKSKDGYKVKALEGRAAAGAVVAAALKNYIDYRSGRRAELVTYIDNTEIIGIVE